eukprot:scaffold12535_cov17-Tisochrysis_lutea.AAC.1
MKYKSSASHRRMREEAQLACYRKDFFCARGPGLCSWVPSSCSWVVTQEAQCTCSLWDPIYGLGSSLFTIVPSCAHERRKEETIKEALCLPLISFLDGTLPMVCLILHKARREMHSVRAAKARAAKQEPQSKAAKERAAKQDGRCLV